MLSEFVHQHLPDFSPALQPNPNHQGFEEFWAIRPLRSRSEKDVKMTSHNDWKVFETNFERAHEQFMKTLIDNYQDLTPSD
jgi:hypothetical protein